MTRLYVTCSTENRGKIRAAARRAGGRASFNGRRALVYVESERDLGDALALVTIFQRESAEVVLNLANVRERSDWLS